MIKRVSYLKLLGVTFQDSPTNWDKHFDDLMERALKRMHWPLECVKEMFIAYLMFDYLFDCLRYITFYVLYQSLGCCCSDTKYLNQIDRLLGRAFRFGYIQHIWRHGGHIACSKTMKWRTCRCSKKILWELNSFLIQRFSFVLINLHRC